MLVRDGHLYGVQDGGIAFCWKADTGESVWSGRLAGGFSASPVMVGDLMFATSESGRTFVLKATPEKFELLGENQLGTEVMATPTFCGNCVYLRVANSSPRSARIAHCIGTQATLTG